MKLRIVGTGLLLGACLLLPGQKTQASSHREAPFLSRNPKVDGTDFYMFNSYESGRGAYVTLIANYLPLQDRYGGPNYFTLDPEALYEIHIDNDGDAQEDITFQFQFDNALAAGGQGLTLPVGPSGSTVDVAVPFINLGGITAADDSLLNVRETYTMKIVRGDRRTGTASDVTKVGGGAVFEKPVDNIGSKSLPAYAAYANSKIHQISIPGCTPPAGTTPRVFVGQRNEGFAVNLGQIFDLVNMDLDPGTPQGNPIGPMDQGLNIIAGKNVTTIAVEVPASCLNAADDTIIGGWTTASVRQARVINPNATYALPAREGGPWAQVSRLGMPLVNEVVIGIPDKDRFNSSEPSGDGQFAEYVTNPTLPEVLEILFGAAGVVAPNTFPRADLVAAFLTGVPGVNATTTPSEMVRLNTGIPATPAAMQNNLGAAACFDEGGVLDLTNAGCDPAGFPNGRRPGDDVVDVELRVAMGYLLTNGEAPSRGLPFTDGALVTASQFDSTFPYLTTPNPGAP